jgi:Ca2+-binding RTX toxin-like protein
MAEIHGNDANNILEPVTEFFIVDPGPGYYNDSIFGYAGDDILDGRDGDDYLDGDGGNDALYGASGNDTLYGDSGYDYLDAGSGNDYLSAGSGNDYLFGGSGNDYLSAGSGNDYLFGESGNDYLFGESGNDYIDGGAGNDYIDGFSTSGIEYDTLAGGTGTDTFVLGGSSWGVSYLGNGYATITDFSGVDDYIQVLGSSNQYSLSSISWSGTSALDTGIFFGNDCIAIIQDTTDVNIARDFQTV